MALKNYIESIDLLRGVCLILMVFINFFDEIARVSLLEAKQGFLIDFFITSMVPGVFIVLMGFLLIVSKGYRAKQLFRKAMLLLAVGGAVNLIRVPVPQLVGNLMGVTQYGDLLRQAIYHASMIDIYSFAGYALLLVIPLTYARLSYPAYFALSALVMMLTSFKQELLGLLPQYLQFAFGYIFIGETKNVYFPLFPWLAYLLLGVGLGILYAQRGRKVFYRGLGVAGAVCLTSGFVVFRSHYNDDFSMLNHFYKHDYIVGLYLMGVTMLLIFLAEKLLPRLPQPLKQCLAFTSRHIMKMYCLSWFFTGWFVTLRGMHNDFGLCESVIGASAVYLLSLLGLFAWKRGGKASAVKSGFLKSGYTN